MRDTTDKREQKRRVLKVLLSASSVQLWLPPTVAIVSLPSHAQTTCDLFLGPGLPIDAPCEGDFLHIYANYAISTSIEGLEVLDVYSDNPNHTLTWVVFSHTTTKLVRIRIRIKELNATLCQANPTAKFSAIHLSPATIYIETSCGTLTATTGP